MKPHEREYEWIAEMVARDIRRRRRENIPLLGYLAVIAAGFVGTLMLLSCSGYCGSNQHLDDLAIVEMMDVCAHSADCALGYNNTPLYQELSERVGTCKGELFGRS
jgi:hypothetical protein